MDQRYEAVFLNTHTENTGDYEQSKEEETIFTLTQIGTLIHLLIDCSGKELWISESGWGEVEVSVN